MSLLVSSLWCGAWSEPGLDAARHRLGRDAVAVVQGRQRAGIEEGVRQGDLPEGLRDGAAAQQRRRHRLAETADDAVVLGHDAEPAAAGDLAQDGRLVKRLDGGDV